MSCPNVIDEHGNLCGDEGRRCEACEEAAIAEHAWMARVSLGAVTGVMSEREEQDLIDAGRAHLVRR